MLACFNCIRLSAWRLLIERGIYHLTAHAGNEQNYTLDSLGFTDVLQGAGSLSSLSHGLLRVRTMPLKKWSYGEALSMRTYRWDLSRPELGSSRQRRWPQVRWFCCYVIRLDRQLCYNDIPAPELIAALAFVQSFGLHGLENGGCWGFSCVGELCWFGGRIRVRAWIRRERLIGQVGLGRWLRGVMVEQRW